MQLRLSRIALVTCLALGGAMTAVAMQPNIADACERDKCDGLTCVDSGSADLSCSITPGGSCVTSPCGQT